MPPRPLRAASPPIAWLALAIVARAQDPAYLAWHDRTEGPTLSSSTPGALRRSVCADFTGDRQRDVFCLIEGEPVFFYAPATWDGYHSWSGPTGVNDLDVVPGPSGTRADLAVVGSSGLQRCHFQTGTLSFATTTLSADAYWTGAVIVRSGYVDDVSGTPTADFVGVTADRHTVVVRRDVGGSPVQATFTLPWTIEDLHLVQWDGAGELELVVLDTYGVELYTRGGTRIKRFPRIGTGGDAICVFHKGCTEPREHVAWIRRSSSTGLEQELVELHFELDLDDPQLVATDVAFPASDPAVCVTSAETRPGESCTRGDSDLVVHHQSHYAPWRFRNLHSGIGQPSFALAGAESPPNAEIVDSDAAVPDASTIPGAATMPLPVFADFNGDMTPDLFVPIQSGAASRFQVWRGTTAQHAIEADYVASVLLREIDQGSANGLRLGLDLPEPPPTANALEVTVWSTVPESSTVEYRSEGRFYYQSATGGYPATQGGTLLAEIPLVLTDGSESPTPDEECFERVYWFEVRQSQWTPGSPGALLALSPTHVVLLGSMHVHLTPWINPDFSQGTCFDLVSDGALELCEPEQCPQGIGVAQPVSVGAMTRRRMAPSGSGIPPAPPAPLPGN